MSETSLWKNFCDTKEIKEDTIYNCELWAKENGDFEEDATLPPTNESILEFIKDYLNQFDLSEEFPSQCVYDEYCAIKNFYKQHKNNGFTLYKSGVITN